MACEEIRESLPLYAGGELGVEERVAAEAHLALCAACARELDLYREARSNLSALAGEEAPPGTWKSLWSGVRAEFFVGRRALHVFDTFLRHAAVFMIGLTLGVVAYLFQRGSSPNAGQAPTSAVVEERGVDRPAAVSDAAPAVQGYRAVTNAPGFGRSGWKIEIEPRQKRPAPRVGPEGNYYLPRVEAVPASGEKDF